MGQGSENLELAADAGPEGAALPWRLRWHLGDRESWSPRFSEADMRGLGQTLLAGQMLSPYVTEHMPDVAAWLEAHTQTWPSYAPPPHPQPPSKGWPLLRRAVSLVVAVGR